MYEVKPLKMILKSLFLLWKSFKNSRKIRNLNFYAKIQTRHFSRDWNNNNALPWVGVSFSQLFH